PYLERGAAHADAPARHAANGQERTVVAAPPGPDVLALLGEGREQLAADSARLLDCEDRIVQLSVQVDHVGATSRETNGHPAEAPENTYRDGATLDMIRSTIIDRL